MTHTKPPQSHIWHSLTQHKTHAESLQIAKAKGALLFDNEGNSYIDAIASWYTCMYGHCNPHIIKKVSAQMQQLDHVVFSGFTHKPAIELSKALINILPNNQEKIFFSDNGSTSVEVAMKMALQFFYNKNEKRSQFIAFENAFHGDTFGAMSASGLSAYNGPFKDLGLEVNTIPLPTEENFENTKKQFKTLLANNEVAAFIYEPLVQGAGKMKMYTPQLLNKLISMAKEHSTLIIADEVMTGFGKTGKNFASNHILDKPDFICLSKSLTGGFGPMGITSCTQEIFDAFYSDQVEKAFFHAHTYAANPTTCAAALASIELLQSNEMQANIERIASKHQTFNTHIKNHPKVKSTRQLGVIFALDLDIEIERYGTTRDKLSNYYMNQGVFLRPLGSTVYTLPPYVISNSELDKVYNAIEGSLNLF